MYNRGCTAGALNNLQGYEDLWNEVERKRVSEPEPDPTCVLPQKPPMGMSVLSTLPDIQSPAPAQVGPKLSKSKRRRKHAGSQAENQSGGSRRSESRRRMEVLTEEYNKTRMERETLELELGRRGLLAAALDNGMFFPIMRSVFSARVA
jgi:hypothetical protein